MEEKTGITQLGANQLPLDKADAARSVTIEQFPSEIARQLMILSDLSQKVSDAQQAADKAKEKSDSLVGYSEKKIFGHVFKRGDTKKIVEETQGAVKENIDATTKNTEALELSFRYQEATMKAMEFLYGLGCLGVAENEAMIQQLSSISAGQKRLEGFKLTDDIKGKIIDVANRLKQQQDVLQRQNRLEGKVKNKIGEISEELSLISADFSARINNAKQELKGLIESKDSKLSSNIITLSNYTKNSILNLENTNKALSGKIDSTKEFLEGQMKEKETSLSSRIDSLTAKSQKSISDISGKEGELSQKLMAANSELNSLRELVIGEIATRKGLHKWVVALSIVLGLVMVFATFLGVLILSR